MYYNSSDSLYYIEACLNNGESIVLVTFNDREGAMNFFNRLPREMTGEEDVLIL